MTHDEDSGLETFPDPISSTWMDDHAILEEAARRGLNVKAVLDRLKQFTPVYRETKDVPPVGIQERCYYHERDVERIWTELSR